jgi:Outer membrane protein beta-barrel domain
MLDRFRFGVCFGVGLCCVAAAPSAAAAPRDFSDVVHFSLDGSLLSYQKQKFTPTDAPGVLTTSSSSTTYGLLGSGFGIGLGYGLTDSLLVGTQLQLASTKESSSGDTTLTQVQFLPRLEYLFEGSDARPYVAAILGVGHQSTSIPIPGGDPVTLSGSQFLFGGSFGVHAFLSDTLSIDPALTFLGASGSQTTTEPGIAFDGAFTPSATEHDSVSGYQIVLSIGLSGWLGGAPAEVPPSPPNAEPEPLAPTAPVPAEKPVLSAFVGFPDHRELRLQVAGDPNLPAVVVDVLVRDDDRALSNCQKIQVMDGAAPLTLYLTGRGDKVHNKHVRHFVTGVLPVHALTVLARPGSALSVCDDSWPLTPEARHQLHEFLARRFQLTTPPNEPLEPESPPDAPPAPAAATPDSTTPASNAPAPPPVTPPPAPAPTPAK